MLGSNVSFSVIVAYLLFVLADAVMYISMSWFLAKSFKLHRFAVSAFLIWIVPFIYSLFYAGSLINLLWMLIFTPVYGSIVMILIYPAPILLYYVVAFGSLLALFIFRKKLRHLTIASINKFS